MLEPWRDRIEPVELADALALRSTIALEQGDGALAGELAREAWTLVQESDAGEQWPRSLARMRIGRVLTAQGFHDQAEVALQQSLAVFESQQGMGHRTAQLCRVALVELYTAWGQPERAAEYAVPPGGERPRDEPATH
jgi:ATP/maltotriose-dependent transcriptional regulator MalT